jgi:lysophospholipase L1-like esterase
MSEPEAGTESTGKAPSAGRFPSAGAIAAYAGGALTAAGALSVGVLLGQVLIARLTIPGAEAPPPRSDGEYGPPDGIPLRVAVIGDSTAAGYGVRTRAETPGALIATGIAEVAHRPVHIRCPAVVGSVSAWLPAQVETVLEAFEQRLDLAVIFIGANDVTTASHGQEAVDHLADAVRTLRATGAEVVVATCPDLGTIRPIRPPLRWLARRWSRQFAAAQTVAAVRAGARTVSLGELLGPRFDAAPDTMFGADRYHPSAQGYRAAVDVVLPSALAALGLAAPPGALAPVLDPADQTTRGRVDLSAAAVAAARTPGTEVTAEGTFTRLRRRIGLHTPTHTAGLAVPSLTGAAEAAEQGRKP